MSDNTPFTIVLKKLSLDSVEKGSDEDIFAASEKLREECEQIAELRRIVLEITEPPLQSYTTT